MKKPKLEKLHRIIRRSPKDLARGAHGIII
jgi:hypothetical protein